MEQFVRFVAVGIINTFFGYGVYCLLLFLDWHYTIAALGATVVSVCFNFFTTGNFVFQNRNYKLFFRYVLLYAVLYVVGIIFLDVWEKFVHSYYFAGLINVPIMAMLSYLLQKNFVFHQTGS